MYTYIPQLTCNHGYVGKPWPVGKLWPVDVYHPWHIRQDGWGGESCAIPTGTCEPKCGAHGLCNAITSSCECEKGYTGRRARRVCMVSDWFRNHYFYWLKKQYIRLIPIIVIYHIILRLVFNPWIPLKGPYAGGDCTVKLAGCPNDCSLHGVLAFFGVRWVHWVKIKQYVNVWDLIIENVRRSRMYKILTIKNSDFTCFFQQKGA